MLKIISWTIKTAIFSAIVLFLGNWIHWKGATLSDHIKSNMAQVERHASTDLTKLHIEIPEAAKNLIRESRIENKKTLPHQAKNNPVNPRDQMSRQDQAQFRAFLKELSTKH